MFSFLVYGYNYFSGKFSLITSFSFLKFSYRCENDISFYNDIKTNRNQLVVLIFLAKCVIWNITAQYQYFEFNKMVLKCSYLFIGYDSKWNWYRGYSTTNTKMFVSWFVFLLFLLWISKAFLILCKFFWLSFHFTKKKLFRHASVQITN